MQGIQFYKHLRNVLQPGQAIHQQNKYSFVEWTESGELRYSVNKAKKKQTKKIELEILVMAVYWKRHNIKITSQLLVTNQHKHWCTPPVLKFLLKRYLEN